MQGVSPDADGRRARRVCGRGDDPRLPPRARRSGSQRNHRADEAAHGTNPATATMCGCKVAREVGCRRRRRRRPRGAARHRRARTPRASCSPIPSTLGRVRAARFGRRSRRIVHAAGGLLYYDGANLNAILGKVRPGDMAVRRHPHEPAQDLLDTAWRRWARGRAPWVFRAAAACRSCRMPVVARRGDGESVQYRWAGRSGPAAVDRPAYRFQWAMRASTVAGLRLHAHARARGHGAVSAEFATLNSNYLLARLQRGGLRWRPFHERRASHEFILTLEAR